MQILYLTDQIRLHGGAEKILIQKLNYWVEFFNYNVTLITTDQRGQDPVFKLNNHINHIDLDIDYIDGVSFFNPRNFFKIPKHCVKLKAEIKRLKPDAIFVVSKSYVRLLTPVLARRYSIYNEYHTSYFATELSMENASFLRILKRKITDSIIAFIERFYTKIIFLNQEEFDFYKLKNAVIIPNFYDEKLPNKVVKKKNSIISLGRLCHQKGYDLLIEAWDIVDNEVEDWELNIYGNGDDFETLNNKVKEKDFKNPLKLNEAINNVNEKLSESSFYVMSSRFETFPMVLLEALSNKLPIVSFDSPTGARSIIIDEEDGFLVRPNDIEDLARKIVILIKNKKLREKMADRALKNVERFNAQTIMRKWDTLIKSNLRA